MPPFTPAQVPSSITKDFGTFDAAHTLPYHDGKCRNLHGHTYRVVGTFSGPIQENDLLLDAPLTINPQFGMVIDFGIIKDVFKQRIDSRLDHALILGTTGVGFVERLIELMPNGDESGTTWFNMVESADTEFLVQNHLREWGINKVAVLPIPVTTAEWLSKWMYDEMVLGLGPQCHVDSITVYETPTSFATFNAPARRGGSSRSEPSGAENVYFR